MRTALLSFIALLACIAHVNAQPAYDLDAQRAKLWDFFADKHTEVGDEYKKVQLFEDARQQYLRAIELMPDHGKARRGLGMKKKGDAWVDDEPMPEKSPLKPSEKIEARKKPDELKAKNFEKCADRARKQVQAATSAGDTRAARILASDVLTYAPDDAAARKLRGHEKLGEDWMPGFAKKWREEGTAHVAKGTFGDEVTEEDEQAKEIGVKFTRRASKWLMARTTYDDTRAKLMHRNGEAAITRAMELLGVEAPFGTHRYTITHFQSVAEYDAMLEKVLKLTGDELAFGKKLAGHGQSKPWGFLCRSNSDAGADDMIANTIAINVMNTNRRNGRLTQPWVETGFSYLITSQTLGTCITTRYSLIKQGATASSHTTMPELNKKSGTPDHLREAILREVTLKRDLPLSRIVNFETNDMTMEAAAKSFSLMEFWFSNYPDATRKYLASPGEEKEARLTNIETHFGKKVEEIEAEWREWVLANY
ncbi:MAG: hypothetical protein IPK87_06975 [Planctomycetes bacterium]|nr:hypothetical protein [Planctomycetota bacterium]